MNKYTSIIKTIETALLVLRYGHSTKKDTIDYMKAAKNSFNASEFFKQDESEEAKLKESSENIRQNKNATNIFRMIFKG